MRDEKIAGERTFNSIVNMLDNCLDEDLKQFEKYNLSNKSWINEFRTIHVKGPRRSGHTTAIAKVVEQYSYLKFLQISTDAIIRKKMSKQSGMYRTLEKELMYVNVNVVVVDCATLMGQPSINTIKDCMCQKSIFRPYMILLLIQ